MLWRMMDHANLAEALLRGGKYEGALAAADMGIASGEKLATHYVNRGRALDGLDRPQEALASCARAMVLDPDGAQTGAAHDAMALIYTSLGEREKAIDSAKRALELPQSDLRALTTMGNVLAWHGELRAALPFLEWHWIKEQRSNAERFANITAWDGSDLRGHSLFVAHEQGSGDAIHMARYLPVLRSRAKRVVVECAPEVERLFRDMECTEAVPLYTSAEAAGCDTYVRMMMLPRLLGIDAGEPIPYLHANASNTIAHHGGARIGVAWAGNPAHAFNHERSMERKALEPLLARTDVHWVELTAENFSDFAETAATIAGLDLVISVDTAVAHLAGALGRPVWLMLPRRPDWRWGAFGETTHWYPTMRLFREANSRWKTVIPRIGEALGSLEVL